MIPKRCRGELREGVKLFSPANFTEGIFPIESHWFSGGRNSFPKKNMFALTADEKKGIMKKIDARKNIAQSLGLSEKIRLLSGKNSWYTGEISEKGIRALTLHDGPHGVRIEGVRNTVYPNLCLLACSFDPDVLYTVGRLIGNDCARNGVDVLLAPGINVKRSAVCGRNFEYFSEDPCLISELAAAYVKGVQKNGISATVKHFCCNNQENYRMSVDCRVEEEALFNTYLFPFYKVIKESAPDCIMTSYNSVNGEKTNESSFLQKEVLRERFGFKGLIMSDWGAVTDRRHAVEGGMDLEMPGGNADSDSALERSVEGSGAFETEADRAVEHLLALCEKHAEKPIAETDADVAETVAELISESIVMLKNEDVLPLRRGEKIGVYGDKAKNPLLQGGGCASVKCGEYASPLSLIEKEYEVVFVESGGNLSLLKDTDKILAFIGEESPCSEAYDRCGIGLEIAERDAINELARMHKKVCAVLQNGGAVSVGELNCGCLLETYYCGEYFAQGLMKILNGKSPCGRLAETFPQRLEHTPAFIGCKDGKTVFYREGMYVGYKYYSAKKIPVSYPFGYGIGYGCIEYDDFVLEHETVTEDQPLSGSVRLTNTSEFSGKEVVQIYYDTEKIKKLVWFDKVFVAAGESVTVRFTVDNDYFSRYDGAGYTLPNERGHVSVARNAEEVLFSLAVEIKSAKTPRIDEGMLIEDVYEALGAEAVRKYFSKPLGLAMYADENFVLPISGNKLSENAFEQNTAMMMPLKNLISFSGGKYTLAELRAVLSEINGEIAARNANR